MEKCDAVVVGAGVIGLAVARALALMGREVLILEAADKFGTGTSSRNSEVVHGGLYYPPSSYKAKFCVEGRQLLYKYCHDRDIFCNAIGKLIVSSDPTQKEALASLQNKSHQNGYSDVKIISEDDVRLLEPSVCAPGGALWSPATGIVDSHDFMLHLLGDTEDQGGFMAVNSQVENAKYDRNNGIQLFSGGIWLSCNLLINAAGLWSDRIASMLHEGGSSRWLPPKHYFAKGNYFAFKGKSPFQHLIYPLPDPRGGLGVHATLDANNQVKFGPDVEWLDPSLDPSEIDYTPNEVRREEFYESIRAYWPDLQDGSLIADYVGIRPKLSHPSVFSDHMLHFQDFIIAGPDDHGFRNCFHLLGIESPGLTSSLAIANHIAKVVQGEK